MTLDRLLITQSVKGHFSEFLGSIIIGYLVLSINSGLRLSKSIPMLTTNNFVNIRISSQDLLHPEHFPWWHSL